METRRRFAFGSAEGVIVVGVVVDVAAAPGAACGTLRIIFTPDLGGSVVGVAVVPDAFLRFAPLAVTFSEDGGGMVVAEVAASGRFGVLLCDSSDGPG